MMTDMTAFCPHCYERTPYMTETEEVFLDVDGTMFDYSEAKAYCKTCGCLVYVPAVNDLNVYRRKKAYYEPLEQDIRFKEREEDAYWATVTEALELTGLNFEVEKRPIFNENQEPIKDYHASVRQSDESIS